jgi:hypothetical protein
VLRQPVPGGVAGGEDGGGHWTEGGRRLLRSCGAEDGKGFGERRRQIYNSPGFIAFVGHTLWTRSVLGSSALAHSFRAWAKALRAILWTG